MNQYIIFLCVVLLLSNVDACPSVCTCTNTVVDCSNQQLLAVPGGIPSNTTHLILRKNNVTSLSGVNSLSIPLRHLDLSHNRIDKIDKEDVQNFSEIEELLLDFNMLTESSISAFDLLEDTLRKLSLSRNRIGNLPYLAFYSHRQLTYLDLSYNDIVTVRGRRFPEASLTFLNLSHNPITSLNFRRYRNLRILDIREQALTSLTFSYFTDNTRLESLYLGGKNLAILSGSVFQWLNGLLNLTISDTSINRFPSTMFSLLPNLKMLDISENSLLTDVLTIPNSNQLEHFIMDGIPARYVNAPVLPFVEFLSLRNTGLVSFPTVIFSVARSVKILDLSQNAINSLQLDNSVNTTLQALNVSHNTIGSIADDFFNMLPSLCSMDVSYNRLMRLEPILFSGLPSLREFVTGHNNWSCDCAMALTERGNIADSNISFTCTSNQPFTDNYTPMNVEARFCFECASPTAFEGENFIDIPKPLRDDCSTPDSQIKTSISELTTTAVKTISELTTTAAETSAISVNSTIIVISVVISVVILLIALGVGWILIRKRSEKSNNQAPTHTNEIALYEEFESGKPSNNLPAVRNHPVAHQDYAFANNGTDCNEGYQNIHYASTMAMDNGVAAEEGTYESVDICKSPYALAANVQMQGGSAMGMDSNHYELDTNHYDECPKFNSAAEASHENIYVDPHYVDPDSVTNFKSLKMRNDTVGANPYSAADDNISLNTQSLSNLPAPPNVYGNVAQIQAESHYELDAGGKRTSYMDFCKP